MFRFRHFLCVFGVILVCLAWCQSTPTGFQPGSPWPRFHANNLGDGLGIATGADGKKKWSFKTGAAVLSSPAIAADGTIYIGSSDNNLYAINPDGTQKWFLATGGAISSSPAVGSDGTVYVGSADGNLYAVNPTSAVKWTFQTGNAITGSSPAIGSDGTIYIGSTDQHLYAVNPNGTKKWAFEAFASIPASSPAIGADGTIYIGTSGSTLFAVNPSDGTQKWAFPTGGVINSSPAIAADGTVYIAATDGDLYAVSGASGAAKWIFDTGNSFQGSSPAIGPDGTIYIGDSKGLLYSITPAGVKNWAVGGGSQPLIESSPAIGSDGTIFVGVDDYSMYAYNSNGGVLWSYATGYNVSSSPAIGADGTLYFGSQDKSVYAISTQYVPVLNVTITPSSVTGSQMATGTVNLTGPASNLGDVVTLSSNNSNAIVPATVTVPAGQTSASFQISTLLVTANTSASISATSDGVTMSDLLDILAPQITDLSISPIAINGGSSATATVQLAAPAPPGGLQIALASSNVVASLPKTVTVAGGATTASFTITTIGVSTPQTSNISAMINASQIVVPITIAPATIQSFTLASTTVIGGSQATVNATITLSGVAAASGDVFQLASSNTSAATVPTSVTISGSATSATFPVTIQTVTSTQTSVISATFNGASQNVVLSVTPIQLTALTLNPSTVNSGATSTGTVTINAPSGASGVVINLTSSGPDAQIPATVTVPAGASSGAFTLKTAVVLTTESQTITASYGASKQVALVTIVVPSLAGVSVSPPSISGGQMGSGTVTLLGVAPPGGFSVSLASSSSSVVVPGTVQILAGTGTGVFTVQTSAVASMTSATITAKLAGVTKTTAVTVEPASLQSLTLNLSSVVGGSESVVTATVSIAGSSTKAGSLVTLTSSNPKLATVPASVKIASGASSATFTVTHLLVTSSQTVTIKASLNGESETASLAINPFQISGLSITPSSVEGGASANGSAILNATPGSKSGAVLVSLASSSHTATPPATVKVPVGQTHASFAIKTTPITVDWVATLTGTLNGSSQKATFTIKAPVLLSFKLSPSSIKGSATTKVIGTVTIGSAAPTGGFTVALSSGDTAAASVPTAVTIPAGKTSATFIVTHSKVTNQAGVLISAVQGGVTLTATLTVTP